MEGLAEALVIVTLPAANAVFAFHGHECPSITIGYRMATETMKALPSETKFVAFAENSTCGVDALQWVTGCTAGKGNLVYKRDGKQAYTLYSSETRKGVRGPRSSALVMPPTAATHGASALRRRRARQTRRTRHRASGIKAGSAHGGIAGADRSEPGTHAMSMHPSAIVKPWAKLGARVSIGPFALIGPGV